VKIAHPVCINSELVTVGKFSAPIVQKLKRLNQNRPEFPDRKADSFWSEKRHMDLHLVALKIQAKNRRRGVRKLIPTNPIMGGTFTTNPCVFSDRHRGADQVTHFPV